MIEQPLWIARGPSNRFRSAGQRLLVERVRLGETSAKVGDLGCETESPRALQQGGVGKLRCVLILIISENARADAVERIKLSDGLELGSEVADHVRDQALGLAALLTRRIARFKCRECERARHRHAGNRGRRKPRQAPVPSRRLTLHELVETDAEHSGDELEEAGPPCLAINAEVGGERFGALSRRTPAAVVFLAERRREAFILFPPLDLT